MRGQIFEVYQIDEWNYAWVEKRWNSGSDAPYSHALALSPDEMELAT